jgi:outer membrane protein assembly complex protein YaeT
MKTNPLQTLWAGGGPWRLLPALLVLALFLLHASAAGALAAEGPGAAAAGEEKGEGLRLVFTGNEHLSAEELQEAVAEELTDFAQAQYPEAMADDAAFLIESAYRKAGYAFVRARYAIEAEDGEPRLEFRIVEGPQVLVSDIVLEGNRAYDRKELLPYFEGKNSGFLGLGRLVFVESAIRDAVDAIRDLYLGNGFQQVKIAEPVLRFAEDRSRVEVRISLQEGERITVGPVRFQGDILEAARPDLDKLAADMTGNPFLARRKLMLRSGVQEIYGNLGYPDAQVEIVERRAESSPEIGLDCTISSGPRVTISAIRVAGNIRTATDFILHRLDFRPGDTFSSRNKRTSFQRLYQTGLFSRVAITLEGDPRARQRIATVAVEESLAREIFFQGGWGSYELLRGSAGFRDKNIFGTGRVFRAEVGGSVKSANIEAAVRDPWIFGSGITADLPVFFRYREEPSFTTEELGWSLLLTRDLSKDLSASLGYNYSSTKTKDIAVTEVINPENDYTIASLKLQTTLDNRNDIFFPTGGRKIFAAGEVAEPTLGSGLSFYRFNFGARQFYPLSTKNTLALRYDTGIIFPGRDQIIIPIGERFFNGGEKTVRSFLESELGPKDASGDPLGGLAFNVFSVELRRLLTDRLAASLFMDYGNVSPNLSPEEDEHGPFTDRQDVIDSTINDFFRDFRPGLGAGLQYLLPVGPARMDFAWNPDQNKDADEDSFVVHFSIGMAF